MPENVVDTPKTPEADLTALKTEIKRLEFDVVKPIEEPNFHSFDGADLRQDETRRTQYFRELLLKKADEDLTTALEVREEARFSKYTGKPIPEKIPDPTGVRAFTPESLEGRVVVFRQDVVYLLAEAEKEGLRPPRFDSMTGEAIPQDSLRALLEVRKLQKEKAGDTEFNDMKEQLEIGLEGLRQLKAIKREDAIARTKAGLPDQ
ncbi:hypothetical protein KKE48_05795 [Patescibacteria group bacterium]|nr:hypothetical protein [Patescibacteria group bacterium]MBU1500351.1 hypothetical protein [Patescibacteria group bacterium]